MQCMLVPGGSQTPGKLGAMSREQGGREEEGALEEGGMAALTEGSSTEGSSTEGGCKLGAVLLSTLYSHTGTVKVSSRKRAGL